MIDTDVELCVSDDILSNVPAFIAKLWILVEDPNTDNVISWSHDGRSFTVHDESTFTRELLPKYFKHCQMASFIRQLNFYDFHKRMTLTTASQMEGGTYYHACFLRDGPGLLVEIKRKIHKQEATRTKNPQFGALATDTTEQFKRRHCTLIRQFKDLKQSRKYIRQKLAELRVLLADEDAPTKTAFNGEEAEDDPNKKLRDDVMQTNHSTMTGVADILRKNTKSLGKLSKQLFQQHNLHMKELRISLQSRRRLAKLEEENWKVRVQAAEQDLVNRELEHIMLSKQLEYSRACNTKRANNTGVPSSAKEK